MRFTTHTGVVAGLVTIGLAGGLMFGFSNRPQADAQPPKTEAQPAKGDAKPSPDEADVHKVLEEFVKAFNENDAKKLAATLSATAEFVDDESNRVEGSTAIGEMLGKFFEANKGAKLQITPSGTRTVAPGVVIEDGESVVTVVEKKTQSARRFTVVFAKVDGVWKIASIREYPEDAEVITSEERLKELAWLVGEWVDEGGDTLVTSTFRFSPDKKHMIREYSVKHVGSDVLRGMQWIGVDPISGTIKGWSHDNAGGHSVSTWTKHGKEWLIRSTGVTSDGDESGATYILKPLSKDRIELKVMNKVIGSTVEADATSILVRKPETPKK